VIKNKVNVWEQSIVVLKHMNLLILFKFVFEKNAVKDVALTAFVDAIFTVWTIN